MDLEIIRSKIYEIRGQKVMLDKDLAQMYGVETKVLNQAVKRNIERFPEDFMFRLTKDECLRSQIVTLNEAKGQHLKYMPFAFTEQGVAMLSSVLRSMTAIQVNISIMRAFVSVRQMIISQNDHLTHYETLQEKVIKLQEDLEDLRREMNDFSEDIGTEMNNIYLAIAELSMRTGSLPRGDRERRRIGYK